MLNTKLLTMTAIGAVVASLALAGCNQSDRTAARNSAQETVAQVDQKAREVGADAKQATQNITQDTKAAAANMGDKIDDAVVTASVKTEIARDADLSAMKINVDTDNGSVTLKGSAPSMAAKEHATTLATGVKGVTSVDNELRVDPSGK